MAKELAKKKVKKEKKRETPAEFTSSMAVVLVTGLFIITFNLQAFEIPSSSMEDSLLIGDHVFVDRVTYSPPTRWMPIMPYAQVRQGDIVVFLSPSEPGLYVVKRVIGLPGDRIHLEEGVVFRNGRRLEEPYVKRLGGFSGYRDDFPPELPVNAAHVTPEWREELPRHVRNGELHVPPDHYFVMGDNRDVSLDSRFWGFVPRENVIGRPVIIYWSFDTPAEQYTRTGLWERVRHIFVVAINFFHQTRWDRMFKLVH